MQNDEIMHKNCHAEYLHVDICRESINDDTQIFKSTLERLKINRQVSKIYGNAVWMCDKMSAKQRDVFDELNIG